MDPTLPPIHFTRHCGIISSILIRIDDQSKYIPALSSIVAIVNIFQKCIIIPVISLLGIDALKNNHYFKYIDNKSSFDCLTSLVPGVGNLYFWKVYFIDDQAINGLNSHLSNVEDLDQYNKIEIEKVIKKIPKDEQHNFSSIVILTTNKKSTKEEIVKLIEKLNTIPSNERTNVYSFLIRIDRCLETGIMNEILSSNYLESNKINIFSSNYADLLKIISTGLETEKILKMIDFIKKLGEDGPDIINRMLKLNSKKMTAPVAIEIIKMYQNIPIKDRGQVEKLLSIIRNKNNPQEVLKFIEFINQLGDDKTDIINRIANLNMKSMTPPIAIEIKKIYQNIPINEREKVEKLLSLGANKIDPQEILKIIEMINTLKDKATHAFNSLLNLNHKEITSSLLNQVMKVYEKIPDDDIKNFDLHLHHLIKGKKTESEILMILEAIEKIDPTKRTSVMAFLDGLKLDDVTRWSLISMIKEFDQIPREDQKEASVYLVSIFNRMTIDYRYGLIKIMSDIFTNPNILPVNRKEYIDELFKLIEKCNNGTSYRADSIVKRVQSIPLDQQIKAIKFALKFITKLEDYSALDSIFESFTNINEKKEMSLEELESLGSFVSELVEMRPNIGDFIIIAHEIPSKDWITLLKFKPLFERQYHNRFDEKLLKGLQKANAIEKNEISNVMNLSKKSMFNPVLFYTLLKNIHDFEDCGIYPYRSIMEIARFYDDKKVIKKFPIENKERVAEEIPEESMITGNIMKLFSDDLPKGGELHQRLFSYLKTDEINALLEATTEFYPIIKNEAIREVNTVFSSLSQNAWKEYKMFLRDAIPGPVIEGKPLEFKEKLNALSTLSEADQWLGEVEAWLKDVNKDPNFKMTATDNDYFKLLINKLENSKSLDFGQEFTLRNMKEKLVHELVAIKSLTDKLGIFIFQDLNLSLFPNLVKVVGIYSDAIDLAKKS